MSNECYNISVLLLLIKKEKKGQPSFVLFYLVIVMMQAKKRKEIHKEHLKVTNFRIKSNTFSTYTNQELDYT